MLNKLICRLFGHKFLSHKFWVRKCDPELKGPFQMKYRYCLRCGIDNEYVKQQILHMAELK